MACQVPNPAYKILGQDAAVVDDADGAMPAPNDALAPIFDATPPPADVVVSADGFPQDAESVGGLMVQGCDPANADLLLCLRFEGNLADQSGQTHALQGLAQFAEGANGRALDLGASQALASAESAGFVVPRFAVEAWVQAEAAPAQGPALLFEASDVVSLWLEPGGSIVCQLGGGLGSKVEAPWPTTGALWKALACTYDGTELAILVNGLVAGSRNVGAWTPQARAAQVKLVEGSGFSPWQRGHLDNVRFWRRRLSPQQLWLP